MIPLSSDFKESTTQKVNSVKECDVRLHNPALSEATKKVDNLPCVHHLS